MTRTSSPKPYAGQVIGSGSNIIWRDEGFDGAVLVNKILGYHVFEEDGQHVQIKVGGGEPWDAVVARAVDAGLTGIEALSLIPGSAGATPVQNVGAYGQDISQTLTTLEAYDTRYDCFADIPGTHCGFGYRTSRFNTLDHGRFLVTSVTLRLRRGRLEPPFDPNLQACLSNNAVTDYTPAMIRKAVIATRKAKLPDPAVVANCGSFFVNPAISRETFQYRRIFREPDVPHRETPEGKVITSMATWKNQPLVLVNEASRSTADLLVFKQRLVDAVRARFGVTLEQEPALLP
ncbi:hypothetical protein GE09DRAFT_1219069 [Coniochaeta sp. 2T2.1]|nr:hypothetical protein GE09DRAFT_1219069 [Coniochaeta sp. 2T2.1]